MTTIATALPTVWLVSVAGALSLERSALEFAVRTALLSAVSWTGVAYWLTAARRPLAAALGIGALSPVLALLLAIVLGMGLLPIEFAVSTPTVTS